MDYEKLRAFRNEKNSFANLLNLKITKIDAGYALTEMIVSEQCLNPIGSVHGGCLFTVADVTAGAAASSYGNHVTTVDSSFHYLRAGLNTTHLYGESRELKHGKRISVYDITVKDQDGVLLAEGIFTYMSLGSKIEL